MSCFGDHDEQIYLIEILVDKLTLTPDSIKYFGKEPIVIKIKFLDFLVFEFRNESDLKRDRDVRFMIGKCYLFVKRPQDLVQGIRSTKLKVGVFGVSDSFPTAETELILPGCLCDQITMIGNDPDNQPKPFTVKNAFHLQDVGKNPSGMIHMELAIKCLGRISRTNYELLPSDPNKQDKEREVCVKRYVPAELLEIVDLQKVIPKPKIAKRKKDKKKKKGKAKKKKA